MTLTLDPAIRDTAYRRASLIDLYLYTKFHSNRRNFLWTDGHFSPSNIIRSTFGSRPNKCQHTRPTVTLKTKLKMKTTHISSIKTSISNAINLGVQQRLKQSSKWKVEKNSFPTSLDQCTLHHSRIVITSESSTKINKSLLFITYCLNYFK